MTDTEQAGEVVSVHSPSEEFSDSVEEQVVVEESNSADADEQSVELAERVEDETTEHQLQTDDVVTEEQAAEEDNIEQQQQTEIDASAEEPAGDASPETATETIPTQENIPAPPPPPATPLPGLVFVIGALEKLLGTREGKRKDMKSALEKAVKVLQPLNVPQPSKGELSKDDVETMLEAMDMACSPQHNAATATIALDCVEKLVSFHYFDNISGLATAESVAQRIRSNSGSENARSEQQVMWEARAEAEQLRSGYFRSVADRLVTMVGRCLGEGTADGVQLQIVKALFALVSSDRLAVRQASMLAAIRTTFNVFVLARSTGTQTISQGTLTQMVHLVLQRVPVETDDDDDTAGAAQKANDGAARDAFLLLRALCKLSMRKIPNDLDPRAPQLRARSLALNLIRLALSEHTCVFVNSYVYLRSVHGTTEQDAVETGGDEFDTEGPDRAISAQIVQTAREQQQQDGEGSAEGSPGEASSTVAVPLIAVLRQSLSLALSHNLVSPNAMVLDLGLAVWELAVQHMRAFMKRELEVIFREILLPVLESKSSASLYQRGRVVQTLVRLLSQPALVVELFLNYDCAEDASVNVFQRLAEVLCKLGGNYVTVPKNSPHFALNTESAEGAAMTSAAWHAVQQKQTVFNMPVSLVLRSAGLENSVTADSPVANAPAASEAGRPSRTFSISSQSSSVNHMMYGGLNYSASEKQAGGAVIDDYVVRQSALDALAAMLQSMVVWSDRMAGPTIHDSAKPPEDSQADRADSETPVPRKADVPADDPEELSSIKHRKERFEEGRKLFAWKPKKGIEAWKKGGLIRSNDPVEIASFFSTNSGIDKMQLGEFLGEGEPHNIAVMHAFVDMMNFNDMAFVDALRLFLQAFRLPGEAQKIDRFMLKFAERYVMGNPGAGFANADAAYVLAYSTIMLNTDQHSPQVKVRMTRQEFINNNRGINDGKNLDPDLLNGIFDQIVADEIKLKDDPLEGKVDSSQQQQQSGPLFDLWGNGPATRIREQQAHASAEMAAKSEQSLRSMTKMRRRRAVRRPSISVVTNTLNSSPQEQQQAASQAPSLATLDTWAMLLDMSDFLHATRSDHIAPMFGTIWAALLAALSSPMQTAADPHVISACLTGFQCGIALACRFRMPLERATFVTTLRNFTQLQNLAEMKRKHVEAIRALVEVAASRPDVGDGLCESWLDVLQCVSQLERLQLLTQGSDPRASAEHGYTPQSHQQNISARAFAGSTAGTSVVSVAELAKLETNSQVLVVTVDRLFTSSVHLSGSGITDFVRALSDVAWGEIAATYRVDAPSSSATTNNNRRRRESAAQVQVPPARLFSLTKIVEISYYNMERIRVEWSQIWAILGPLFDRVGAYQDTRAALFALDSLRQLSMKFLEKEELPHFAFQKEFLRPFADILEGVVPNAPRPVAVDALVKDMVLRCVRQLVQAAARHIRSGWKAVLNVAQVAARDQSDAIAEMGFQLAKECAEQHGPQMWLLTTASVPQISDATPVEIVAVAGLEYFHELIDCLNEFAVGAATRRPRLALHAIDTLHTAAVNLGSQILAHPAMANSDLVVLDDQPLYRVWMPALRAFHEVVMHTEDLEVRTRAVDSFFKMIMTQGKYFSSGLWTSVLRDLVFAMFADLRDPSASKRFATVDDLELWFSTTLIKALRHLIALFTEYYPASLPSGMLAEVLELLSMCIMQPSEILGKIGTSCLQDLIKNNFTKWDDGAWALVCETLARLFNWSQPRELFSIAGATWEDEQQDDSKPRINGGNTAEPPLSSTPLPRANSAQGNSNESADYIHITLKCILQLLLIQTLGELFESEELYTHMSAHHLFILLDCVDQSRGFAHRFNKNRKVRRRLVEMGVMPTMPSLLKQETLSMLTELHILQRMNSDAIGITSVKASAITSDRASVADEVDDRLANIAKNVLEQYCAGGPGQRTSSESRAVHVIGADVSARGAGTAAAKKGAMIVSSWRPCVVVLLKYLPELSKSPLAPKPFQKAVRKVWPELVDLLGVAADAKDLDIVGDVQRVLALAASEFKIVEEKIELA